MALATKPLSLSLGKRARSPMLLPVDLETPPLQTQLSTPPLQTHFWDNNPTLLSANVRGRLLRRNSSVSSATSASDDLTDDVPWTSDELQTVQSAYADVSEQAALYDTPFAGPPPSQLTQQVARNICRNKGWAHTLKSTRAKILELAKEELGWEHNDTEDTPMQGDADQTPRRSKRLALSRQMSGDTMPVQRDSVTLARLSHKLQRTNSSDSVSRAPLRQTQTVPELVYDAAAAYPSPVATPLRGNRLKRTTSTSFQHVHRPAVQRTNSVTHASSSGPDLALYGVAHSPESPPLGNLATPFEPAYTYGLRPKRFALVRNMSGLSIHDPTTRFGDEEDEEPSTLTSSPSSYAKEGAGGASNAPLEGFLHPDYGKQSEFICKMPLIVVTVLAGRAVRRSSRNSLREHQ